MIINAIPGPFNAAGICEYERRSRIAAIITIANHQPIPEPKPYTTDSPTFLISPAPTICCIKSEPPIIAQFTAISGRKIPSWL